MSKQETYARYNLIIRKLNIGPATFKEISNYLKLGGEIDERNYDISKRTFQRDVKEIFALFKIEIVYDNYLKKYKAIQPDNDIVDNRILEAFNTFNALNISERLSHHILFENRKPQGTDFFNLYLHAIKKNQCLQITHQKFWDEEATTRKVKPYAIKEFKFRWYLVAEEIGDEGIIKTFGFDRILNVDLLKENFAPIDQEIIANKFHNFFGVITPEKQKPVEIILEFSDFQAKYIKTLPLHHSQQIIKEDEVSTQIYLYLVPTYDFIQELLSMGNDVEVIKPEKLRFKLKETAKQIFEKYKD